MPQDSIFGYVPPAQRPQVAYGPGGAPPPVVPTPAMAWAPPAQPAPAASPVTLPANTPGDKTTVTPLSKNAAAAYGGFQAAAPAAAAYDTKSAIVSTLGAGASGAAAGAAVGGPYGALIGGGIGLVAGGLNAYLAVGKENANKSKQNRLLAEAEAKQNARDRIARDDAIAAESRSRKEAELQKKWAKNLQVREAIKAMVADGTVERDRYVKTGRV